MSTISFEIREFHLSGSGGSHVVAYSAEMELLDASEPFTVEILSVDPPEWATECIELIHQLIQRAAVRAFEGTGKSAKIRVRDFVIHDVDFKPRYVEIYTYRALCRLLGRDC